MQTAVNLIVIVVDVGLMTAWHTILIVELIGLGFKLSEVQKSLSSKAIRSSKDTKKCHSTLHCMHAEWCLWFP